MSNLTSPPHNLAHVAPPPPAAAASTALTAKRTLESTAHNPAPEAKRPRKAPLPSRFYKECNKMYAQIEASKYDTKEIIKRLVRKSRIDKSELGGPRVCGSSPCPPAPEISIASNTGAPVLRQGVPLKSGRTLDVCLDRQMPF